MAGEKLRNVLDQLSPEQGDELLNRIVERVETTTQPVQGVQILNNLGEAVGTDLTSRMAAFGAPQLPPLSKEEVNALPVATAVSDLPLWKRGLNSALQGIEWWDKNVVQRISAPATLGLFKAIPGEQSFEKELEKLRRAQGTKDVQGLSVASWLAWGDQISQAYDNADTVWGLKGFNQLLFDPLNLVGAGIPGKLATRIGHPLLRGGLNAAQRVDDLPGAATAKLIGTTGKGIKLATKPLGLLEPHSTTQVRETFRRTQSAFASHFGTSFTSGNPEDTARLLSDTAVYPESAGPFSVRNIINHLGIVKGDDEAASFFATVSTKSPEEASVIIGREVARLEGRAIRKGGQRISVDPFEDAAGAIVKSKPELRKEKVDSIFDRLHLDDRWAKGVAAGLENTIGKFESVYLQKIEPNIIRPWALSHLAFAGFGPFNLIEDVMFATFGMGKKSLKRIDDVSFRAKTAHLSGKSAPPGFLQNDQNGMLNRFSQPLGTFTDAETPFGQKIQDIIGKYSGITKSSEWGLAVRRAAWDDVYDKAFYKELRRLGAPEAAIDELAHVLKSELTDGLKGVGDELQASVWNAMISGNPDGMDAIKELYTEKALTQRSMNEVLSEFPELPTDIRKRIQSRIFSDTGLTRDQMGDLRDEVIQELLNWHRFHPDVVKESFTGFLSNMGKRPPKSSYEAGNMLVMLQHMGDALANLPRELRAHVRLTTRNRPSGQLDELWRKSDEQITTTVAELRQLYKQAQERVFALAQPEVTKNASKAVRTSVERNFQTIADTHAAISDNVQKTWDDMLKKRQEILEGTPNPSDRDTTFWESFYEAGDELWKQDFDFRALQSAKLSEAWNNLFATRELRSLSPSDARFMKSGLEGAVSTLEEQIKGLDERILEETAKLERIPQQLRSSGRVKIAQLKQIQKSLDIERSDIVGRLDKLGQLRRRVTPTEVSRLDREIKRLESEIDKISERALDPALRETMITKLLSAETARGQKVLELVPLANQRRYQAMLDRVDRARTVDRQGSSAASRDALQLAQKAQRTFEEQLFKIIEGDDLDKIGNVRGLLQNKVAREILDANGGQMPETIEAMVRTLSSMKPTPAVRKMRQELGTVTAPTHTIPNFDTRFVADMLKEGDQPRRFFRGTGGSGVDAGDLQFGRATYFTPDEDTARTFQGSGRVEEVGLNVPEYQFFDTEAPMFSNPTIQGAGRESAVAQMLNDLFAEAEDFDELGTLYFAHQARFGAEATNEVLREKGVKAIGSIDPLEEVAVLDRSAIVKADDAAITSFEPAAINDLGSAETVQATANETLHETGVDRLESILRTGLAKDSSVENAAEAVFQGNLEGELTIIFEGQASNVGRKVRGDLADHFSTRRSLGADKIKRIIINDRGDLEEVSRILQDAELELPIYLRTSAEVLEEGATLSRRDIQRMSPVFKHPDGTPKRFTRQGNDLVASEQGEAFIDALPEEVLGLDDLISDNQFGQELSEISDELGIEITDFEDVGGWYAQALEVAPEEVNRRLNEAGVTVLQGGDDNFVALDPQAVKNAGPVAGTAKDKVERLGTTKVEQPAPVVGAPPPETRQLIERIYSKIAQFHAADDINPRQRGILEGIVNGEVEVFPTEDMPDLVERGLIVMTGRRHNGRVGLELTDEGRNFLSAVPEEFNEVVDVPPLSTTLETIIDKQAGTIDNGILARLDKVLDEPPIQSVNERQVEDYINRVKRAMGQQPELMGQFREASEAAGRRANELHDKFFINYDNRNTFDFFMQRFMPFWMYESRRWPRLAQLAGSRPILSKYMVQMAADWDYGYSADAYGVQFNPFKGTIFGGLRRLGSRDFPEYHNGVRGNIEQGLDWLGRGGFYFAPPYTAGISLLSGEPGDITPPPLSAALHGIVAAGGRLPAGLDDLAFNSRFLDFTVDQALADAGFDPKDVRRGVESDEDWAIEEMDIAKTEAARRLIIINQSSIGRYRPTAKTTFIEDSRDAVEQIIGVDKETQDDLRQLGIPLYSVVVASGFQRRALRESIPNYDAWASASYSLRPLDEQRDLQAIDEFWQENERQQLFY